MGKIIEKQYGNCAVKIKKPIEEAKVIELRADVYKTLRSFVESSSKEEYEWNKGVKVSKEVIFTKKRKWKLIITQYDKEEVIKLPEGVSVAVYRLMDKEDKEVLREIIDKNLSRQLIIDNKYYFIAKDPEDYDYDEYANKVAFTSKVLFARPIFLGEIIKRLREFGFIALVISAFSDE
jgi:hypothetical protein